MHENAVNNHESASFYSVLLRFDVYLLCFAQKHIVITLF